MDVGEFIVPIPHVKQIEVFCQQNIVVYKFISGNKDFTKYYGLLDQTCDGLFQQLSNAGDRLIIATNGVWDALSSEKAATCGLGLREELAAKQIVKVQITSMRKASE